MLSTPRRIFPQILFLTFLTSCAGTSRGPSSLSPEDSRAVGSALKVVADHPITVVPLSYHSVDPKQVFNEAHPLTLDPGDAFVLKAVSGNQITVEFDYDEIIDGVFDASAFPEGALEVMPRSDDVADESASDGTEEGSSLLEDVSFRPHTRAQSHSHGSGCALTPHKPGCCLAAVKYWLRDHHLIRPDLSNFPGVYAQYATSNLPSNFQSVGCAARTHPSYATVCSYHSSFNPAAGHVEVFDGTGWYFGLGHETLQNDGHHSCIDCKVAR